MALGDTSISVSGVKTETGLSTTNDVLGLNTSTSLNAYSFWNPRPLVFNGSTKVLEPSTDPSPYAFGDFRRYDHAAVTPSFYGSASSYSWNPGTSTITVGCIYDNKQANIYRANSNAVYTRIRFYTTFSGGVFSGQVGSTQVFNITKNTSVNGYALSPALTDHAVQQTQAYPSGSSGLMLASFPTSGIGTSAVTRYAEMWFTDNTGSVEYGTLATNYFSFTAQQNFDPIVQVSSWQQPSGATIFPVSLSYSGNTIGSTSISFSFRCGMGSGTFSGYLCLRYVALDSSTTLVAGKQNVAYTANNTNTGTLITVTGFTLPGGRTWNYGSGSNYIYTFQVDWNATSSAGCF